MPTFRPIARRFGALYALVTALLLGVSVVVFLHLGGMREDSARLIEEAREQAVAARLLTEIDSLSAALRDPDGVDEEELLRARELLLASRVELAGLEGDSEDPSLPEHQEAEDKLADRIEDGLAEVDNLLVGDAESVPAWSRAREVLGTTRHYVRVLLSEAREEAHEADRDLQRRARTTRTTLIVAWASTVLLLGAALVLIDRGVVRPLRRLRAGAERFGEGQLDHRIQLARSDEIGDLAVTFNSMAHRLAHAQETLESRVRKRTQEFLRAARLADLGLLASGIAHEINTPLGSIASSAEGLRRRVLNGDVPPELLEEYSRVICDEAYRARDITTRMLGLVRQEPSEVATIPLRLVVDQAESALRHRAEKRRVRVEAAPVPDGVTVTANAGELIQVLANLLANAIDASPPEALVRLSAVVREGRLVLEVADEGSGIPEEDLERVFEPFYTTKSPGHGTGLGLALVATLVESHGGRISVRSEVGHGATFRVELPADWSAA